MEALKKNKILLSIFAITVVVFAYYFFFTGSGSDTTSADAVTSGETSTSPAGQQILNMLAQLNTVKIDTALFAGSAWISLVDLSAPTPTDAPGKTNLFAPIGQR